MVYTAKKYLFVMILLTATDMTLSAAVRQVWDFEAGTGKWRAWGTKPGMDAEKSARIVTSSDEKPHGGKQCLRVRDDFDNASPYAVFRVEVDPTKTYVFKGFIRSDGDAAPNEWVGVSALGEGEKFIRWLETPKFKLSAEWQEFWLLLSGLPAGTKYLYLAVKPSFYAPSSSTGTVCVDDVEFCEQESAPISIRDYTKWFTFPMNPKRQPKPLVDIGASLLHTPAGKHGFVQSKNGHFYYADGNQARFWAVNIHSSNALFPSHDQAERVAETLSRSGINLVRFHLTEYVLIDRDRPDRATFLPATDEKWERFDYFVKCLKDKGVYILLDSVTGLSARGLSDADVPHGSEYGSHRPWVHFEPAFIELGKAYIKGLLTHVNTYTGKALKDEPAIAMLMLINEQTMFFDWKSKPWPAHYQELLKKKFNAWLIETYGTRGALATAWTSPDGLCALKAEEDPAAGTVSPVTVQEIRNEGDWKTDKSPPRIRATVAFFRAVQTAWQKEMLAFIRSLGCVLPVADSNIYYDIADLETQTMMDYTSQNVYYDHVRRNSDQSLSMANIPSVERNPLFGAGLIENAIAMVKINTKPVTSTESNMMWPHEWRSSYFLTAASAAALQDWDAMFFYCYFGGFGYDWDKADAATAVLQPTVEFNDPALLATLPNAALMYHRRDVAPGKNLVQVVPAKDDIYLANGEPRSGAFPLNYVPYVSRYEIAFGKPDGRAQAVIGASGKASFNFSRTLNKKPGLELAKEFDDYLKKQGLLAEDRGIQGDSLVSDTGEVIHNFGKGLLIVDTPRTQGFTGFPKDELKFRDIRVTSRTGFTTILVSSLDGAGLDTAKKMLLTVIARAENDKDNMQYASFSKAPNGMMRGERLTVAHPQPGLGTVRVEPTDATVLFKTGGMLTVTPLAPDMSALSAPVQVATVETASAPTVWYLVERK